MNSGLLDTNTNLFRMILRKSILLLLLVLPLAAFSHNSDTTKYKWYIVPDEQIQIKLPSFFEKGEGFKGFIHKESGTSIVFHSYPDYSYKLYHSGYIKQSDYLNTSNTTLAGIDTVKYGRNSGYLYRFNFAPEEVQIGYKRKLFITGNINKTLLVMINYPETLDDEISGYFEKALKSIKPYKDNKTIK